MSFAEILGQGLATEILNKAIQRGKLAHAYLFHGIEGVGKEKAARTLAKAVNCHSLKGVEPCAQCPSCLKIEAGNHPDVNLIQPEGAFIRIEQIRSLQKQMIHKPLEGRYRVAIVTSAHLLNRESANCLLKTLEEPPQTSVIILIATNISRLLPTIVSRCQAVSFRPLPPEVIADYLSSSDSVRFPPEKAALLASLSTGSLGRAIKLAASPVMEMRTELCKRLISISRKNLEEALILAGNLAAQKEELPQILDLLKTYFRDMLFLKQGIDKKYLINKDLDQIFGEGVQRWNHEQLTSSLELLSRAEQGLSRNYNRQLMLENVFLQLAS